MKRLYTVKRGILGKRRERWVVRYKGRIIGDSIYLMEAHDVLRAHELENE